MLFRSGGLGLLLCSIATLCGLLTVADIDLDLSCTTLSLLLPCNGPGRVFDDSDDRRDECGRTDEEGVGIEVDATEPDEKSTMVEDAGEVLAAPAAFAAITAVSS